MALSELYIGCRTYRRFKQDPIPDELIHAMLENARIANCGMNAQTLRYVCVKSPEAVAKMQPLVTWARALPREIAIPKPEERPTAFIVIVKTKGAKPVLSDIDSGIAAHVIASTAWEGGVGSCIMFSINRSEIAKIIGLKEGEEIALALSMGYPAHTSTIVPIPDSGCIDYYVDDKRNYYVPKRAFDEVAKII